MAIEAGAAAYMVPLWRRWSEGTYRSQIVLGPAAEQHMRRIGFVGPQSALVTSLQPETFERDFIAARADLLVASATGAPIEAVATQLARRHDIPSVQIIDTWNNYIGRFADGYELPDRIAVIDNRAAVEAAAEGLPAGRITPVGHPAWELARPLAPAPIGRALFVSQPIRKAYGDRLGYDESAAWSLCRRVADRRPDLIPELIYLPHPSEGIPDRAAVAPSSLASDPHSALAQSGTIFGMFSSLMVDAVLGERRVISVQPNRRGPDLCSLHRHGFIRCAETAPALEAHLAEPYRSDCSSLRRELAGSVNRFESLLVAMLTAAKRMKAASP